MDEKQLQRDVLDELQWEPSVDAAMIGVTVREGVVTLVGTVPSYTDKVNAGEVAERVHGVKAVANDLEVRLRASLERTDTDIAEAALEALRYSTTVPDVRIKVAVSRGWITLNGEVDWHYQRMAAEDAVRHLAGVTGVTNDLSITPKALEADLESQIDAAFRRSAKLGDRRIAVKVHDGTVTLKGDVHSWGERQEAEQTAWSAPGVTRVENLIMIKPWGSSVRSGYTTTV